MTLRTKWAMSLRPQSVHVCPFLTPQQLWSPSVPLSQFRIALVSPLTQASVLPLAPVRPRAYPPKLHLVPPRCPPLPLMTATHTARATSPTWSLCLIRTFLQRVANRHRGPCISANTHSMENLLHDSVYSLAVLFFFVLFFSNPDHCMWLGP